jgi:MFS transporter, PPP family, 3-phenylpropionic acid transporter
VKPEPLRMEKKNFPNRLFLIYVVFYSGQAIYNTYLNLYLYDIGLTQSQIGMAVSVSTLFLLLAQTFWGSMSDRATQKNTILKILYLACSLLVCLFYVSRVYWFVIFVITLFSAFFVPVVPLVDNMALELLEKGPWDYSQVRMGGTIGYAVTVVSIGFMLNKKYSSIFWMVAVLMLVCFILFRRLPPVHGYRKKEARVLYREIFRDKGLVALIIFNLIFSMGLNFFYSFYPIYFSSIGGTDAHIGVMMFACSVAEIPCLMVIGRMIRRFGIQRVLICAGLATSIRWFLLFLLHDPILIIAANLLHGFGFTAFSYGLVTYINEHVPRGLRATSQSMNALIGTVCSRVIFGYLGGLASELLGANRIMLVSCCLMAVATVTFVLWSHRCATPPFDQGSYENKAAKVLP